MNSFMYFPAPGYVYVTPTNIQVDGDKVYVSAGFSADVPELGWVASYVNVWDFMYLENKNIGLFSLDKNDLTNATSVAVVQNSEAISYNQHYAEALNFVADNGSLYVGFIGFGNLSLTTASGTSNFTFATTEDGSLEHAFVLTTIGDATTSKVFNVSMSDKMYIPFNLFMGIDGDNLAIGGTFHGERPFDPSKSVSSELASDIFIATLDKATGSVNSTYVSGIANAATCMAVSDGSALLATAESGCYELDFATGEVDITDIIYSAIDFCGSVNSSRVYVDGSTIYVNGNFTGSAILGDIDGDGEVIVADATALIAMILDPTTATDAADIDGDGEILVADAPALISIILGTDANGAPAKAAATRAEEVATSTVSADGDGSTLLINISNPEYPFSAIQFDLDLPEGIEVEFDGECYAVDLGSRTSSRKHSYPECAYQEDGSLRVVIVSMSNALYSGTEGDVATAALKVNGAADGEYQFTIKNVVISAPGSKEKLADHTGWITVTGGVTGIDSITADGVANSNGTIYDLQGRKVTETVKGGIYIKDGKKFIAE